MAQRTGHHAVAVLISLLLAGFPFANPEDAASVNITTFSDGSSEANLTFPSGGGWDNTTSVTIPAGVTVKSANVTLTPGVITETGHFAANASELAAGAQLDNLKLRSDNLSLADGSYWWGQNSTTGFNGSLTNDTVSYQDSIILGTNCSTYLVIMKQSIGVSTLVEAQQRPSIATNPDGDMVITWEDARNSNWDIYAQRINSEGKLIGRAIPVCTATDTQGGPAIGIDSRDNIIITWHDHRSSNYDIYARRLDKNGTAIGNEIVVASGPSDQLWPDIALDSRDNFIITWMQGSGSSWDIYAKRYDKNGSQIGNEIGLTQNTGDQGWPAVAVDSQDRFILTWHSYRNGNSDIYAASFDANGDRIGNDWAITTNTANQFYPDIAFDSNDNFTIVWTDLRNGNRDIYSRKYFHNGSAIGPDFGVCMWPDDQGDVSSVCVDSHDDVIFTWASAGNSNWDLYSSIYAADGTPIKSEFPICIAPNDQVFQSVAMNNKDQFFVTWQDFRNGNADIYLSTFQYPYLSSGMIVSSNISSSFSSYGNVHANISRPDGTDYSIDVLDADTYITLQSGLHSGDLVSVGPAEYPSIRLRLTMFTNNAGVTPQLYDWGIGTRFIDQLKQVEGGQNLQTNIDNGLKIAPDTVELWEQRNSPLVARTGHAAVWDAQNNQLLILAGASTGGIMNDLWAYNPENNIWSQKHSSMTDRIYHSAIWDDQNNQVLVFGGYGGSYPYLKDLWAYSPSKDSWTQKASASIGRARHCAVWDSENHQMLVFGGSNDNGISNDLWAYFPSNNTWVQKANGATSRQYPAAIWDPDNHQMLVFSGWSQTSGPLNDLWAYYPSNNTWVQKQSASIKREGATAIWDLKNRQMLIFGGSDNIKFMNDTWAYSPSNDSWVQKSSGSTPRSYFASVWDKKNDQMLVFGGTSANGYLNDLWRYYHSNLTWTEKPSSVNNRYSHAALWDPANKQMIVFGGRYINGANWQNLNDTWTYSPYTNTWTSKASGPSPRLNSAVVWDDTRNQMILFGGFSYTGGNQFNSDVWTYSPISNIWTQKADCPIGRGATSAIWDSEGDRMIVFGGQAASGNLNDCWFYYPSTDTWVQKANGATARRWHTAVWDNLHNQMLVFGGDDAAGHYFNDLWSYSPSSNTWTFLGTGATGRSAHSAIWNPALQEMIIFAGETIDGPFVNDIWIYSANNKVWRQQTSELFPRWGHSAVWVPDISVMVVFGGKNNTEVFNDLWFFGQKYLNNGSIISMAKDIGHPVSIGPVNWDSSCPTSTSINISIQSTPDNKSWSSWERLTNGVMPISTPTNRFIRWRAELSTSDNTITPILQSLTINYMVYYQAGVLISAQIPVPGNISSAIPRLNAALNNGTIALRLSADNGSTWEDAPEGLPVNFSNSASDPLLQLRLNASPNGQSPLLHGVSIDYEYKSFPSEINITSGNCYVKVRNYQQEVLADLSDLFGQWFPNSTNRSAEITISLSFYSATAGTIHLSNLNITYIPVTPSNQPPVISNPSPPDNSTLNSTDVLLDWTTTDPENDTLTFEILLNGTSLGQNLSRPYQLTSLSRGTSYTWQVRANDTHQWAEGPVWHFTVSPGVVANTPPTIHLVYPPDKSILNSNSSTVELKWSGLDIDSDNLSYTIYFDIKDATTAINSTNSTAYNVSGLLTNTLYYWNVIVSDGKATTASPVWSFRFDIITNHPPSFNTVTLPNATVGKTYMFRLKASDPDNDSLVFALLSGPTGMTVDTDGAVRWKPSSAGTVSFTVRVSDGLANDTKTFNINVKAATPPQVKTDIFPWLGILLVIVIIASVTAYLALRRRKAPSSDGNQPPATSPSGEEPTSPQNTSLIKETQEILAQLQTELAAPSDFLKLKQAEDLLADTSNLASLQQAHAILTGLVASLKDTAGASESRVEFLSEVEFYAGYVRLKAAIINRSDTVITDTRFKLIYDAKSLRLSRVEPEYELQEGDVVLGNINPGEKRSAAFYLDPLICTESALNGIASFKDSRGNLKALTMKPKKAAVVCPIFHSEEQINVAMLKQMMDGELTRQDRKAFRIPAGTSPESAFDMGKAVVAAHDVRQIREFMEKAPYTAEAWYFGKTKPAGRPVIIRVRVIADMDILEFFVACDDKRLLTGLLAELAHNLVARQQATKAIQSPEPVSNEDLLDRLEKTRPLLSKFSEQEVPAGEIEAEPAQPATILHRPPRTVEIPAQRPKTIAPGPERPSVQPGPPIMPVQPRTPIAPVQPKPDPVPAAKSPSGALPTGATTIPNPFKDETMALKTLSNIPRGLPGSLSGRSMDELAEELVLAQFAETEDGDIIVKLGRKWFFGDPKQADTYLQPYKG